MLEDRTMAWGALWLSLLTGCGDPDSSGTGEAAGGSTASGGSTSSGGSPGSGGSPSATTETPDLTVELLSLVFTGTQTLRVRSPALDGPADECERREEGTCTLRICPLQDLPDPATYQYRHAGQVTATWEATDQTLTATLDPESSGSYIATNFEPTGHSLVGGESGAVAAVGGDIAAFQQDVTFPLLLLTTTPAELVGQRREIEVPSTGDFELAWDRGQAGIDYMVQSQAPLESATHRYSLGCLFDSSPGSGTIPGALLEALPSGATLLTLTVARHDLDVAGDLVRIHVATETTTPDRDGWTVLQLSD